MQQGIRSDHGMADSVEALGVDLRTSVKKLGAKEKAIMKKCKVRFSKNVESACSGDALSLFMETSGLEVEEELSTKATC